MCLGYPSLLRSEYRVSAAVPQGGARRGSRGSRMLRDRETTLQRTDCAAARTQKYCDSSVHNKTDVSDGLDVGVRWAGGAA